MSGSSEEDIAATWEINATASFKLMQLAVERGIEQFFFASTAASYGPVDQNPMPLNFEQWPESLYGATKVAVERAGVYFTHKHGLDFRLEPPRRRTVQRKSYADNFRYGRDGNWTH